MLNLDLVEEAIQHASGRSDSDETSLLLWLRRRYDPQTASMAVRQITLRRRAQSKFSRAHVMWFTPDGLEQSSAEIVARYHASRFPEGTIVADAGCGIGGDLIALAGRGPAVGIERDDLSTRFAQRNLQAYGVEQNAWLVHADLRSLHLERAGWLFLDPARRSDGRRGLSPEDWQPDWGTVCALARVVRGALIKTTPALPAEYLPEECEQEYISVAGECRELLLSFGACRQGIARRARLLPENVYLADSGAPEPEVRPPLQWVYDPDPAVVAGHLVAELAQQLQAYLLHPKIAYLTGERYVQTPFARAYRLLEHFPYSRRQVLSRLRAVGAGTIVVKKRGVMQSPEELVRDWKPAGERKVVVLLYRADRGVMTLLAEDTGFVTS